MRIYIYPKYNIPLHYQIMINIDKLKEARRRRITEEIKDAMQKQGLSRKDLAVRMKRSPSEVTRWLSGDNPKGLAIYSALPSYRSSAAAIRARPRSDISRALE